MKLKAYKYRLYPTKSQESLLEQHFGASRWVYNYGLERRIKEYQEGKKRISAFDLCKEVVKLKKQPDTEWLNEVNAQSIQVAIKNLDHGFKKFFKKTGNFPKFKSKRSNPTFSTLQGSKVNFEENRGYFMKIGWVKVKFSREFKGRIVKATFSKNRVGQYFVSYTVETNDKPPKPKKVRERTTIGIDVGLKDFIVTSDGKRVKAPKFLKENEKKLAKTHYRVGKKKKGSRNREKARKRLARVHLKISNQRSDFIHKLTHQLVCENQAQTFALETLQVSNMMKNHNLAKSIADVSWSEFVRQMEYKCAWYGKSLLRIGTFEPSSKMCGCGAVNKSLKLHQRTWKCKECGVKNDRDLLAANNIKRFALSGLGKPVEPVEMSQ